MVSNEIKFKIDVRCARALKRGKLGDLMAYDSDSNDDGMAFPHIFFLLFLSRFRSLFLLLPSHSL